MVAPATTLKYRGTASFRKELQPNGKYAVRNVPIFECHTREDIGKVDADWMRRCVADQTAQKAKGFLPRLIVGHTSDEANASEKPVVGYLDNYRYEPKDEWLYADYVDIEEADLPLLSRFPGRSAEANVRKPQIHTVALLGGTPPYFRLPDTRFHAGEELAYYSVEIPKMEADPKAQESNANGESPEKAADYAKFCEYMKRFMAEEAEHKKNNPEPKEPENKSPEKKDDPMPEEKFADKELTAKYADLSAKYDSLLARVDTLTTENATLAEQGEKAAWTAKYAEKRIPSTKLNITEEVDFLMGLPKDKRQAAFDKSLKMYAAPSTTQLPQEKTGSKPEPGSAEEAEAVKKYAADKGIPYAEAQRRYIKEVRNA